jgi:WD40 repeat protein
MIVQGNIIFTVPLTEKSYIHGKELKVWEWETGRLIREISLPEGHSALAIQGDTALSGSGDGMVRVLRISTQEVVSTFKGHSDCIHALALHGNIALTASQDSTVRVWNWATGALLTDFRLHESHVIDVKVQGDIAFSASQDCTVKVWYWATGKLITDFCLHQDLVHAVIVQGEVAFSASAREVFAWNWRTGKWLASFVTDSFLIYSLALEPDHQILLVGTISGDVHVLRIIGMRRMLKPVIPQSPSPRQEMGAKKQKKRGQGRGNHGRNAVKKPAR